MFADKRSTFAPAITIACLLGASCGKTPPLHILQEKAAAQNKENNRLGQDAGLVRADGASAMPDSGLVPDSGVSIDAGMMTPTDCSANPNRCVPNELISPAPECRCLNRCEDGWMWDSRRRRCVMACESDIVPPHPGPPPCARSTLECLFECEEPDCQDQCFDNEPNQEPCFACINQNYISCFNRSGCQEAWDATNCCTETNCPEDPDSCRDTTCGRFAQEYQFCIERVVERCQQDVLMCFPQ